MAATAMKDKKRAVILHGYRGKPFVNWYPWLGWKLRRYGYKTYLPWLPQSRHPDGRKWTKKIIGCMHRNLDNSLLIGHSAGAVQILNVLMALPPDQTVDTAVLVSLFRPKPQWSNLQNLVPDPFDFEHIKTKCRRFIFVHASNDPLCPLEDAQYYAGQLNGELVVLPTGGHFSILRSVRFWRFPELIKILTAKGVLNGSK